MKSWKSTLGGALTAAGTLLMGIGITPQFYQDPGFPSKVLTWVMLTGFLLNAAGAFFGHLYAADQATLLALLNRAGIDTSPVAKTPSTTPTTP